MEKRLYDTNSSTLPDGWAAYLPIAASLVRALLGIAGGAGFTWALTVNADQVQMAVSASAMLIAALWGAWQKIQAMRALRRAAANPPSLTPPKLPA